MEHKIGFIKTVKNILNGYAQVIKQIFLFFVIIGGIAGISILIVTPFWYFATNATNVYTFFVLIVIAGTTATSICFRVKKAVEKRRKMGEQKVIKEIFLSVFKTLFKIILLLVGIYIVALLYISDVLAAAVPGTIVLLFVVGYLLYGKKRTHIHSR